MSNLARTPSQFFINLFVIFLLTMTMYSFFRACGALCSSLDVGKLIFDLCDKYGELLIRPATRLTGVAIQALIVYTGEIYT